MASDVGIVNTALQLIKHSKQITSLTSGTKEANAAEVVYDETRDLVLDMHNWNFATRRQKLGRLSGSGDTPVFEFEYSYQLPSDYIRAVSIHDNSDGRGRLVYRLEADRVVTDAEDVYMVYIARITDPNAMPPTFRRALSKLIGSQLATALAQSTRLQQMLYEQFIDQDLPTAKSVDSIQDFPVDLPESDWITARYGNQVYGVPGDPPA